MGKKRDKKNIIPPLESIAIDVTLTSFMTAVTIFFVGILISTFDLYASTIKIPIFFLIVSTFSFLFSTMIYVNMVGEIIRLKAKKAINYIFIGNVISEYLGIYLLVISIPLVINTITDDWFLRIATFSVAVGGLMLYSLSEFSLTKRYIREKNIRVLFSVCLGFLSLLVFLSQVNIISYFVELSMLLLLYIVVFVLIFYKAEERT